MRNILLTTLMLLLSTGCRAQDAFGTWKMNPARSQFIGDSRPRAVTVRIEPHGKGEAFTWDQVKGNGQAETFSAVLYLDGKERNGQPCACSGGAGIQSSRQLRDRTVEITTRCEDGRWFRIIRRFSRDHHDLVLDITETQSNGHRFERHLVLEK